MRVRLGVCVVGVMAVLAACGGGDDGSASDTSAASTSATTLAVTTTVPPTTRASTTAPPTTAPATTTASAEGGADAVGRLLGGPWSWTQVADGAPWGGRAGLRVLDLGGRLYLMGGRTPKQSVIPGDSTIWGDVWASDDSGATWTQVLADQTPGSWPGRAYFQAVVKDDAMWVLGGQNFAFPSTFYNDVWKSTDGVTWEQVTAAAPWAGRAGLSAAVLGDYLYVLGGSKNDDSAVIGPSGPVREYFNDVWRSKDGKDWEQVTDAAPWEQRAGAVLLAHDGALWLLGGEKGFLCQPQPGCTPPYFNDVWRSTDGKDWEQVTAAAGWSPRPGHTCEVVDAVFICFGGFGLPANPQDVWISENGADWILAGTDPWGATSPDQVRYDFDSVVHDGAILTVGGDRETFNFGDPENYLRVDDDVWRFGPSGG